MSSVSGRRGISVKDPPRELQRIDMGPHRLEHVREIPRAHGAVVRAPDFGEALVPGLGAPLVDPEEVKPALGFDHRFSLGCNYGGHPVVSSAAAAVPDRRTAVSRLVSSGTRNRSNSATVTAIRSRSEGVVYGAPSRSSFSRAASHVRPPVRKPG